MLIDGTNNGMVTGSDGEFSFTNVSADATITVSMLGYQTQQIQVNGRTRINVVLAEDSTEIDELVIIGYGVVRRSDLTSSISTVKGEELTTQSTGNAMVALQGKTSGIQVTAGGAPGDSPRVIIRGISTVNKSNPLYVVDGMPLNSDNINFLNSNDIESIEVLKDASASAIYGTRASNGVILVTTKRGKSGPTQFELSASMGFQTLKKPDMAKASTYEKFYKARYINDGSGYNWNVDDNISDSEGTDWWDQTVSPFALQQDYTFSFRGGNEKMNFAGSLGYFRQESQFDYGAWDRLTARFNMEYRFNDIVKFGVDLMPRWETNKSVPDNIFASILNMDPTTPVFRAMDEWGDNPYDWYARSYHNQVHNPVATIARRKHQTDTYGLIMNPFVTIEPIKGLIFRTQFGVDGSFVVMDDFSPAFHIDNLEQNTSATATREMLGYMNWNWTNTVNWMRTFNSKHNVNVMAGYTMEQFLTYNLYASVKGVPNNDPTLQYPSAGTAMDDQATGKNVYTSLMSYLGRAMYNYDNRYYITASVRVDGSSRFPMGNKYATFPAVSAAWRLGNEVFMKEQNVFDDVKIRAGWGRMGNQEIANDVYISSLGSGDYVFGGNRYVGTQISRVANSNVQWETVEDYSVGVDFSMLGNRLNISADWFTKKSKDMLLEKENLLVLGYPMWNGRLWENVGSMKATGWEFSVDWGDNVGDFRYNVGVNLTHFKNRALKLADNAAITTGEFGSTYINRNEPGALISRFYGYIVDGIFQNWTDVLNYTNDKGDLMQSDAQPGDFRYRDVNGDGVIDDNDRTFIGNAFPKVSMGLNINLAYKNFDLVANFYGTFGNDIYNSTKASYYSGNNGNNVYADAWSKAWKGEGTSNTHPRISAADLNRNYSNPSTFFVEDGSYFRCKVLQIGYTFPERLLGRNKLRVYVSGQNLFTITNYSGFDPERGSAGEIIQNQYSVNERVVMGNALEAGIDNSRYPNPRTYLFGVNLTF